MGGRAEEMTMQYEGPKKMSDVPQYVKDVGYRWRHVDELQKEIKSTPDNSPLHQMLLDQYAEAVADVCAREECLKNCVENGEIPATLIARLKRSTGTAI
jgi:hypothetical protein